MMMVNLFLRTNMGAAKMNMYQNRKRSKQAFMEAKDFPKTTFFERHTSFVVVGIWLFFAVTSTVGTACIVNYFIQ